MTPFEQQALDARREGKKVEVMQQKIPGQAPVVSLREFAGVPVGEAPIPAPAPELPATQELVSEVRHAAERTPVSAPVTSEDLEQLKTAIYGAVKPAVVEEEVPVVSSPAPDVGLRPVKCPRCYWDLDALINEPTTEDKLEFVESTLGNRRFTKEVPMLGGKVKVLFRTMTVEEDDAVTDFINEEVIAKRISTGADWSLWFTRCRMVTMLQQLTLADAVQKFPVVNAANYKPDEAIKNDSPLRRAMREVPTKWPLSIQGMVIQSMAKVDEVYTTLMARAYDTNFWDGLTGA